MHAAVLHALGKPPRFEEFPEPTAGEGGVLIHVCAAALKPAALHEMHLVVSHKLCDLGFVFVGDCYHDETFAPVLLLQAVEARHFLAARRTPRGPEVQHHNLAPVLG